MASDRSTERILDLLYGELSPEEEAEVREELAESAPMRAELESFENVLGDIRGAMPDEEVSSSVHASILEAARAAAKQPAQTAPRRGPEHREGAGVWRRMAGGQGSQIALVAAVLIAGVFVVKFLERDTNPTMAPVSDVSSVSEPAPPPLEAASVEELPAAEELEVLAELEELEEAPPALAPADVPAEPEGLAGRGDVERKQAVEEKSAPKRAAAKPAPMKRERAKSDERPRESRQTKKSDAVAEGSIGELFDVSSTGEGRGNASSSTRASADDEVAAPSPDIAAKGAAGPESQSAPMAQAEAAPAESPAVYRPQTGTISAVEQRSRANDYTGTIAASDEFLASDAGSAMERARALQLKADALLKLGRYAEADRVYESIQKNYPTYQSAAVNAARATLQERLRKQPARQERSAPKAKEQPSSYDAQSLD